MRIALLLLLLPLYGQDASSVQAYVPQLTPLERIEPAQHGAAGIVRVLVTVDPDGRVTAVESLTGPEILRKPAAEVVQQWRFRPVLRHGHSVVAYTDELVTFFVPGKPPGGNLNSAEEFAAAQRINALQKQFPRLPEEVLADLEQDSSAQSDEERFYNLTKLAKAAWQAGALEKASQYAGELVGGAQENPKDWNYGNAIHDGNSVLGLVAFRGGNVAQAGKYLLEAGKTPGSPQLNSFGPNMTLAKQLLEQGEKTIVLEYFSECRTFWKMGGASLNAWTATVQDGGIPNFGANLLY